MTWYTVQTWTSDLRSATTDADVFVMLHGSSGVSPRVRLPAQEGDFARGAHNSFRVEFPSVGTVEALTIGHNNQGQAPTGHLDRAEVLDEDTGGCMSSAQSVHLRGRKARSRPAVKRCERQTRDAF